MDILVAVAIGFALIGIPLAWYGIHSYRKNGARYARANASWVKTKATVLDARLEERESTDSDGDSTTWYDPKLHYRFVVGERAFEGTKTALCTPLTFWLEDLAQKWLGENAPGNGIDIWYDPEHPEDNAPLLDKPSLFSASITVFVGMGFLAAAAAMLSGIL